MEHRTAPTESEPVAQRAAVLRDAHRPAGGPAPWHDSPRMVAQRRQIASSFGSAVKDEAVAAPDAGTHGVVQRMLTVESDESDEDDGDGKETAWFVRWYAFDGETYTPRTLGLPSATGWIEWKPDDKPSYRGKPVYVSIADFGKLKASRMVSEVAKQVREVIDEKTPILRGITDRLDQTDLEVGRLSEVQHHFLTLNEALGNYLSRGGTFLMILLSTLGLTVTIAGGVMLSYVTLPMWAVALVDGLSLLYGLYVLYRWSSSELLPGLVKVGLVLANALVMVGAVGPVVGQAGAYLAHLTDTLPLQHITLAALPFALIIEQLIVALIEKVNALRETYNRDHRLGGMEHQD